MPRTPALTVCLLASLLAAATSAEEWAGVRDAPERPAEAIRIASYNVLNLFDDRDDPSLEGRADDAHSYDKTVRAKPREQLVAVAKAMREIDADVVGLQEIESREALIEFREEHLAGMGYDHVASVDVGYFRGVEQSVLSRFPIKEVRVWPVMHLGGEHPPLWRGRANRYAGDPLMWRRSPLMVTVEVPAGARGNAEPYEMTLFVVHHKSGGGNEYWREGETRKVLELVEEIEERDRDANIVVLGDFNAQADDESMRMYFDGGMTDVFEDSDAPRDERVTHASGRIIDFILVNDEMEDELVEDSAFVYAVPLRPRGSDWRTTEPPAGFASDHLPVVVDIVPVDR
jgi:endonuclease/exonuclease/phosphatase family metal-dependent hydrolase